MGYFNYHARVKKLIIEGHLVDFEIVENYKKIGKVMLLVFDNNKPIPIREYRFEEYSDLINEFLKK